MSNGRDEGHQLFFLILYQSINPDISIAMCEDFNATVNPRIDLVAIRSLPGQTIAPPLVRGVAGEEMAKPSPFERTNPVWFSSIHWDSSQI